MKHKQRLPMSGKDGKADTRRGNYAKCQDRTTDRTKKNVLYKNPTELDETRNSAETDVKSYKLIVKS
jgi:hypothetical protein